MSIGDIIALIGLVFALLTYVYSIALWPRINILIDEDLWVFYFVDLQGHEHLCLKVYFTFFNDGAQPGAMANLLGTLSLVDGSGAPKRWDLRWNWFFEMDGTPCDTRAHTFVVAGRSSGGTKSILMNLLTDHQCTIIPGKYLLELRGLVGPKLNRWTILKVSFQILEKEANLLNTDAYKLIQDQRDTKATFLLTRKDTFMSGKLNAFKRRLSSGSLTFYHPSEELGES